MYFANYRIDSAAPQLAVHTAPCAVINCMLIEHTQQTQHLEHKSRGTVVIAIWNSGILHKLHSQILVT